MVRRFARGRRDKAGHIRPHDALPYRRAERRVQQHVVLADGVVGKALSPQLAVILLHAHGR